MSHHDEVVRQALAEEAAGISAAGTVIDRLLGLAPRRQSTLRRGFLIMVAGFAVLMVSPLTISFIEPGPQSLPAAAAPLPNPTSEQPARPDRSALGLGHVDMGFNGVHVELAADGGPDRWLNAWQHPCLQSLLTPLTGTIPSDAICAVRLHGRPLWEILVSPRYATVPIQSARFRWVPPLSGAEPPIWLPVDSDALVDGQPVWVSRATGKVRYPSDRRHVRRVWTSIYFPERDAQVSILAPSNAAVAWLAAHIFVH